MRSALSRACFVIVGVLTCGAFAYASESQTCASLGGRPVAFKTSEGSLLNLDVSPDGKWIAFDMFGDLYVLPAKGGKARRLTSGSGWDFRPVWSPDGKRIAFISDRLGNDQVFVVNAADGKDLRQVTLQSQLTEAKIGGIEGEIRSAEWMPDGSEIVVGGYLFRAGNKIDAQRSKPAKFYSNTYYGSTKGLYYFKPTPSSVRASTGHALDEKGSYEVWKLEREAIPNQVPGLANQVPSLSSGFVYWGAWEVPAVSANARWLVYRDRSPIQEARQLVPTYTPAADDTHIDTIRVYDQKRGVDRVLVGPTMSPGWRSNGANRDVIGFSANTRYAVSPDSNRLFVSYGGKIHSIELESGRDAVVPMSVGVDQCLAPIADSKFAIDEGSLHVKNVRSATKSPDGRQLIFSALRRLYVKDLRGGSARLFHHQDEGQFEPTYSPDGKWIAYVTWSDIQGGHVWRARADGSVAEKLTNLAGYYLSPTWSPDGEKIAFVGSTDLVTQRMGFDVEFYGGGLNVISLKDRSIRQLPQLVRLGSQLSFSGDGKRIYFTPHMGDWLKLISVGVDGSGEQDEQVHKFPLNNGLASATVQPGGSSIAVVKFGNIYLITCPSSVGPENDFSSDQCREMQVTREGGNDPRWRENGQVLEWSFADSYYRANLSDLLNVEGPSTARNVATDRLAASGRLETVDIDLVVPRRQSSGVTAIKGARIITMRGDEVIAEGTVVINKGRIEQIGPMAEVRIPNDAKVIDLTGKTLLPGLIDAHAHFNSYPRDLLAGNHWEPLVSLAFGITTIKNPSNGGDHAYAYAELVETGDMVGPRMFSTPGLVNGRVQDIESLDDALNIASRNKRLGATFLKYHTGFNRWQRRWIIEAARETGLNVAAHLPVPSYLTGRPNLSTIYDGVTSSEHEITDSSDLYGDVREFLIKSGVWLCFAPLNGSGGYPSRYWESIRDDVRMQRFYRGVVPTSNVSEVGRVDAGALLPLRPDAEANGRFLAELSRASEQVVIGSHGNQSGIGMHLEMWAHVRGGMTPHQVLRAATLNGAHGLGVEADLGSLEVGKIADLLVLDKNPLEDIRNTLSIEMVVKGGVARDARSLAEIWPTPQPLPQWQLQGAAKPHADSVSAAHGH